MFRTRRIACGSLLALLVGCGGGSGDPAPISVAQMVSQLSGGEVKVGTSGAALLIPPGSLPGDTLITANAAAAAASVPAHSTVKGLYYDLGPDGTTFDPPATLTLPVGGTPPTGAVVVISMLANGQWQNLETTTSGAGMISAQVPHFTGFAVRWLTGGVSVAPTDGGVSVAPTDGGTSVAPADGGTSVAPADGGTSVAPAVSLCRDIPAEACGGNIVADWKPSEGCFVGEQLKGCDDAASKFSYDVKLMGQASFKDDMTYALDLPYAVTGRVHASPACLRAIAITACAQMQEQLRMNEEDTFPTLWPNTTCTGTAATGCDCTSTATGSFAMPQTGTYTAEGTMFSTTATADDPSQSMSYCVDGNMLWVRANTDSNEPEYLVFTK